ncbi:MAG: hypothetical protein ACI8ZN_001837, partial [Bacteroidia bacterium]
ANQLELSRIDTPRGVKNNRHSAGAERPPREK